MKQRKKEHGLRLSRTRVNKSENNTPSEHSFASHTVVQRWKAAQYAGYHKDIQSSTTFETHGIHHMYTQHFSKLTRKSARARTSSERE